MIEQVFRAMVLAQPSIAALVSDRVFQDYVTQAPTRPYITFQIISGPRKYTQDGADGVTTYRIQTDVWGDQPDQCAGVRDAIEATLSGKYNESFGSPAMRVQGVFIDNESAGYESALDAAGPKLSRKRLDLLVTVGSD